MSLKPCLGCGEIGATSWCVSCRPTKRAKPTSARVTVTDRNPPAWRRLSARLRRRQPWCSWCGSPRDLTVDHIVPQAERPDLAWTESNLQVLCRTCNSRKGTRGVAPPWARLTAPPLGEEPITVSTSRELSGGGER